MLEEIHEWFVENLRDSHSATRPVAPKTEIPEGGSSMDRLKFQLFVESEEGSKLVCGRTGLHPRWNEKRALAVGAGQPPQKLLFECLCSTEVGGTRPHADAIAMFGCELSHSIRTSLIVFTSCGYGLHLPHYLLTHPAFFNSIPA